MESVRKFFIGQGTTPISQKPPPTADELIDEFHVLPPEEPIEEFLLIGTNVDTFAYSCDVESLKPRNGGVTDQCEQQSRYSKIIELSNNKEIPIRFAISAMIQLKNEGFRKAYMTLGFLCLDALKGKKEVENDLVAEGIDPKRALRYFQQAAAMLDKAAAKQPQARVYLVMAEIFKEGLGCRPAQDVALMCFEIAAKADSPEGCKQAGIMHRDGVGTAVDLAKAEYFLEKALAMNCDGADCELGETYFELGKNYRIGRGVNKSIDEAINYLKKAVNLGCDNAKNDLGLALLERGNNRRDQAMTDRINKSGVGGKDNAGKAAGNYLESAKYGCHDAYFELGMLLYKFSFDGDDTAEKKSSRRYDCFSQAAQGGCFKAFLHLAKMNLQGHGGPDSKRLAFENFTQAAKYGDAEANLALGRLLASGHPLAEGYLSTGEPYRLELSDDAAYETIYTHFCIAAKNDIKGAYLELEKLAQSKLCIEGAQEDLFDFIEAAAKAGNPEANLVLGRFYKTGFVGQCNYEAAAVCFGIASNNKEADQHVIASASFELGSLHKEELLQNSDSRVALKCFKRAGELGSSEAYIQLGLMYRYLLIISNSNNLAKAHTYFEKASGLGNYEGTLLRAKCYADYNDKDNAIEQYRKAHKMNNSPDLYLEIVLDVGSLFRRCGETLKAFKEFGLITDRSGVACFERGLLQLSGYGSGEDRVEANPEEAVKSFKDAYDKGYMPATYELGKYYYELNEHYLGLEKPNVASAKECFDTAKSYFEIALKHGIKIFHYDELTGLRPPNPNAGRIG